jgi:lipoate-protein ligase A
MIAQVFQKRHGLPMKVNDRHDILLDGRKISGSAFRITKERSYHHGTMLLNSDLNQLTRLLRPTLVSSSAR